MKVARVLLKSVGRPRAAIERDGVLYDVETLERALAARPADLSRSRSVGELFDPSDFQTRVGTLRCAGLYDLDMQLIQGSRPGVSRLDEADVMRLAPCDTERSAFILVDTHPTRAGGKPICRIGQARALGGQDALVSVEGDDTAPIVEIGVAAVIGDDLSRVTAREAAAAIMGLTIVVDWLGSAERSPTRGLHAQAGPTLVSRYAFPNRESAIVTVDSGGERRATGRLADIGLSIEEAIAFASGELALRAGDLVAVGPLPMPGSAKPLALHEEVVVDIEGLGSLRGRAVPRRPHDAWQT